MPEEGASVIANERQGRIRAGVSSELSMRRGGLLHFSGAPRPGNHDNNTRRAIERATDDGEGRGKEGIDLPPESGEVMMSCK